MSEKRPNVFSANTNKPETKIPEIVAEPKILTDKEYEATKLDEANQIYNGISNETGWDAVEAMRQRTEEQMRLRDEMLDKNKAQTQLYQDRMGEVRTKDAYQQPAYKAQQPTETQIVKKSEPKIETKQNMTTDSFIQQLSQPQFNSAFDVIPLPSEGKLYKSKKANMKVAYMTAADENILTSPNLLQSGDFLEILMNRKILDSEIRYKDLHVGDRNAIMLWLRATSYGEMYPVVIYDENNIPFETEINLNELKIKKLGAEPDENGYFDFVLPVSKQLIKFKLLSIFDLEEIERMVDEDAKNELPINNISTYTLEKQIVEINGETDRDYIFNFIQSMRIRDSKELRVYIDKIECGIELELEIQTPRGGSVKTFLPLSTKFFWPDLSV
jgi:hypothetical protein